MSRVLQHVRNVGIVAALGVLAIVLFQHGSHMQVVTLVMIWATFAYGWNVLGGYAGQMSAGHSMYFGIGAFVPTLMFRYWGVPPSIGIFAGIGMAVLAALLIGWPTFRLSGVYFTLATLAYPLMAIPLVVRQGWSEVASPLVRENAGWYFQFDSASGTALLALGVLLIAVLITSVIDSSNLGLSMRAVRDNEPAAEAAGINTFQVKMKSIAISAAISAAAGTVMVSSVLYIATPHYLLGFGLSVNVLIIAFVGGSGSIWGPLLGAAIIIPTTDLLTARFGATLPGLNGVLLGGVLMLVVLFAPTGIWGRVRAAIERRRRSDATAAVATDANTYPIAVAADRALHSRPVSAPIELGDVILRTDKLSRHYGGLRALDEINLEVRQGELLGVIGPNGAGKTTLFDTIGGHTVPTSGRAFIGDADATGQKPHRLCRLGLARTFQVVRTFEEMSVFNNVRVGALVTRGSEKEIIEIVDDVLELVGLAEHRDEPVTALNTADLRRMEFARALASKPKIILADECLAGLGGQDVQVVVDLLRDIRDSGVTVVVIEHTMAAMVGLVDRFVVLDHGAVIADGDPAAVVKDPAVIEAYLGKKWMANATT